MKKKMQGSVDRGKMQPQKSGNAAAVMSHRFKAGSDKSAPRHAVNVQGYQPRFQNAASAIHAILGKGKR